MSESWWDTLETLKEEIRDELLAQDGSTRRMDEFISELVDGSVPVYNGDRLAMVDDKPDLAYADGEAIELMGTPVESIYDFLGITIYVELQREAYKILDKLEDSIVRCGQCDCIIEIDDEKEDCTSEKDDTLCQACYDEKEEEDE